MTIDNRSIRSIPACAPVRAQTLVVLDAPRTDGYVPRLGSLLAKMGQAVIGVETDTVSALVPPRAVTRHRIAFDANMLRDTVAHDYGYRFGFLPHCED